MYVLSISSVSEVLMDFTLDFYFRQFWTDPRLAYKKRAGVETLSVGSEFIRNIWVPDTFFVNEKQSYFHTATTSNEFIRIHHSGSITRSIRLTITASCPMNLQYFPMDRQLCHIEIESFGYTMTDILYVWKDGASSVGMSSEVQLPQFRVLGHRQRATVVTLTTGKCVAAPPPRRARAPGPRPRPAPLVRRRTCRAGAMRHAPAPARRLTPVVAAVGYTMRDIRYKWNEGPNSVGVSNEVSLPQFKVLGHRQRAMEISLTTGNYSRLACEIQFVRSMGYYLIQIYIPSGLIVIISWVSFWLNRNATPARVQLGVTTVLTMTTLMSSTNAALPKISYVKSIDVYLGTCFVMVFTSLLEYATVGYMSKRIQMRKQRFVAIQKIMSEKKLPECPPPWEGHHSLSKGGSLGRGGGGSGGRHSSHGSHGSHGGPPPPPPRHARPVQEVRYKVRDPARHSKGATLESCLEDTPAAQLHPLHPLHPNKDVGKFLGMTPSDIDKYSRIVFPVCFVCFNLMYWIVYLHVSDVVADDLVLLEENK
ncbi:unnamed protein product [Chrysodeixis includens]|uniref:Gamma-aminobutyric acid receptor subunit beta n=1 Tax=Chrysodeixis includens TaxID=689277 RepID=A0A9P0BUE6_CHRIL|nr:unnamed protein product [Chrysodeixis includens]